LENIGRCHLEDKIQKRGKEKAGKWERKSKKEER
jgi:hypothetical protein